MKTDSPATTVEQLQALLAQAEGAGRTEAVRRYRQQMALVDEPPPDPSPLATAAPKSWDVVSSGVPPLDRQLPAGGFRRGSLVEWLTARSHHGSGASALALRAAREAARQRGAVLLFDSLGRFYPPAAVRLGLDPARLIVVRTRNPQDEQWALEQACRAHGVAAVLWWGDRLDAHHFRRLQLAVERSLALGLLIRPARVQGEPSWAESRWLVEPRPTTNRQSRRLRVELLRCRGAAAGMSLELEINEQTGGCHVASPATASSAASSTTTTNSLRLAAPVANRPLVRRARRA